jgi:hypothetical protein
MKEFATVQMIIDNEAKSLWCEMCLRKRGELRAGRRLSKKIKAIGNRRDGRPWVLCPACIKIVEKRRGMVVAETYRALKKSSAL